MILQNTHLINLFSIVNKIFRNRKRMKMQGSKTENIIFKYLPLQQ
jgi:hypothetical protein